MTDLNQLGVLYLARKRAKHAHRWIPLADYVGTSTHRAKMTVGVRGWVCDQCGLPKETYLARQRRGRTSLRAGKDGERAIAKAYGGTRVGQFGGASDVLVGELFSVQSKVGWFSERYYRELQKLPRTGGRIPTLIVSDRPGPGHKVRRLVVRLMEDDLDLHGGKR